jgi:hypothetical protein
MPKGKAEIATHPQVRRLLAMTIKESRHCEGAQRPKQSEVNKVETASPKIGSQ